MTSNKQYITYVRYEKSNNNYADPETVPHNWQEVIVNQTAYSGNGTDTRIIAVLETPEWFVEKHFERMFSELSNYGFVIKTEAEVNELFVEWYDGLVIAKDFVFTDNRPVEELI